MERLRTGAQRADGGRGRRGRCVRGRRGDLHAGPVRAVEDRVVVPSAPPGHSGIGLGGSDDGRAAVAVVATEDGSGCDGGCSKGRTTGYDGGVGRRHLVCAIPAAIVIVAAREILVATIAGTANAELAAEGGCLRHVLLVASETELSPELICLVGATKLSVHRSGPNIERGSGPCGSGRVGIVANALLLLLLLLLLALSLSEELGLVLLILQSLRR